MRCRLALVLVLLCTVACSTNPATGKRQFNIVSEAQEIGMGQQAHQQVIQQFGTYDEKPELARRVDEIGKRLAARSERSHLPWHFTVLDTPMVNAMALPGGYIYITRGMLERINSDDELAGVLGHEIAHVTARHAAQQISRSQLAQFGMVLGSVIAGPQAAQQYGQLAQIGIGLLFQRYSRAHETEADLLGTDYIARARFNPTGAERMLMTLQRMNKNPASGLERYFQSHPDPGKRIGDVRKKAQELAAAGATFDPPERAPFLRLVDGVITGNSTERTVIRGNTIYDRDHGLIMQAPAGWVPLNEPGMLFGMVPSGRNRGSMQFIAQEVPAQQLAGSNAQNAIRNSMQQMGLRFVGSREARTASGERFAIDVWSGQTESGPVGVESTQFPHGDHVAVFLFVAPGVSERQSPLADVLSRAVIDRQRARSAEPPRMRIGTVRSGESWADIARRATGNAGDAEAVANINGFDLKDRPPSGLLVKLPQEVVPER